MALFIFVHLGVVFFFVSFLSFLANEWEAANPSLRDSFSFSGADDMWRLYLLENVNKLDYRMRSE